METVKKNSGKPCKRKEIVWIHTPRCRECAEYNAALKQCGLIVCRYLSKL